MAIGGKGKGARIASIVLVVGLFIPLASHTASAPVVPQHNRIALLRNDDGSSKFGPRNSPLSYNWSGYAIHSFQSGQPYTSGSASWKVPKVSFERTAMACNPATSWGFSTESSCYAQNVSYQYSSTWVGIGGSCLNVRCSSVDHTLIQLGTGQHAGEDGSTYYYA